MYPTYSTGETSKRTPHPDDLAGVELDYPTASDPKSCEHANVGAFQKSSCAVAPHGQTTASIVVVMLALLGLLRRRAVAHNSRRE